MTDAAQLDALVRLCEIELTVGEQLIHSAAVKAGIKDKDIADAYWGDVKESAESVLLRVKEAWSHVID